MHRSINDFLPDGSAPEEIMVTQGLDFNSDFTLTGEADVRKLLKVRAPFSHKGTYGHALIIAGAPATMGAALLCSKACLYGGAGLTTASIPESGLISLNTVLPEVMYKDRRSLIQPGNLENYNSIAIGPGLQLDPADNKYYLQLIDLLIQRKQPILADADALNLLSENMDYTDCLPEGSILTPHMKEFDRLFGVRENWWFRIQTAKEYALKNGIVIVLKNQFTFIIDQKGKAYINPTGGPAMSQGGMGDVLTGLIAAFLAQGYVAKDAAIAACYLHGLAGDDLAKVSFNVTASEVAEQFPRSRYQLQSFVP